MRNNENTHQPHDKLFKAVFQDKAQAIAYMEYFLPENLVKKLDFSKMVLDNNSYLSQELKTAYSDIVYNCPFGKEQQKVKISLLFEHKSEPKKHIHFQLLEYMLHIWNHQVTNKDKLTPVIPLVLYHGSKKWQVRQLDAYFGKDIDPDLLAYIPNFNYLFTDLKDYSVEQLSELKTCFLYYSLYALQNYKRKTALKNVLIDIYQIDSVRQQVQLLKYIGSISLFSFKEIIKIAKESSFTGKNNIIMTTFDVFFNKGEEKGLEKGLEQGLEQGLEKGKRLEKISAIINLNKENIPIPSIARGLNVTEEFVQQVLAGEITE